MEATADHRVTTDLILTIRSNEYLRVSRHKILDDQSTAAGAQEADARVQSLQDEVESLQDKVQALHTQN